MIQNGTITALTPSRALTWAPSTVFQSTLLAAVLLTILSYQATALVHHLLLGVKPRNQARAPRIHALLLADDSTPVPLLAALTRHDTLDALRHRLPVGTSFTRTPLPIPRPTVLTLLALLLAAPVVSVITVTLAIEADHTTTFARARVLHALGLGQPLNAHHYVGLCQTFQDDFRGDITARFYMCSHSGGYRTLPSPHPGPSKVLLGARPQGDLTVEIFITGANQSALFGRYADVTALPSTYRLAHAMDEHSLTLLAAAVARDVDAACDGPDPHSDALNRTSERQLVKPIVTRLTDGRVPELEAEVRLACTTVQPDGRVGLSMLIAASDVVTEMVTLVDVEQMLFLDISDIRRNITTAPPWIVGDGLPVIRERKPIAPFLWIAVALAVVILLRLVVRLFTNNDIADGIEAIVASALGYQDGYEMVRSDETVRYDRMLQKGRFMHYGRAKSGWVEVPKFDRPVGVIWRDNEAYPGDKLNPALDDESNTGTQDSS